jgi:putative transposase
MLEFETYSVDARIQSFQALHS